MGIVLDMTESKLSLHRESAATVKGAAGKWALQCKQIAAIKGEKRHAAAAADHLGSVTLRTAWPNPGMTSPDRRVAWNSNQSHTETAIHTVAIASL